MSDVRIFGGLSPATDAQKKCDASRGVAVKVRPVPSGREAPLNSLLYATLLPPH